MMIRACRPRGAPNHRDTWLTTYHWLKKRAKVREIATRREHNPFAGMASPYARPGDWKCLHCHTTNFSSRSNCFKCDRRKPVQRKPGDWDCAGCGTMNFASKPACYRCHRAKPKEGGDVAPPPPGAASEVKPDNDKAVNVNNDWKCPACDFSNFRRNDKCKRCGTEKSFKAVMDAKLAAVDELKKKVESDEALARERLAERDKELDSLRRAGTADAQMCIVCMENPKNAMCTPCHHVFACMPCAKQLKNCSICRAPITATGQIFI